MLKKNQEKALLKERRAKAGTFVGFRPSTERVRTKYDRKAMRAETRRMARGEA